MVQFVTLVANVLRHIRAKPLKNADAVQVDFMAQFNFLMEHLFNLIFKLVATFAFRIQDKIVCFILDVSQNTGCHVQMYIVRRHDSSNVSSSSCDHVWQVENLLRFVAKYLSYRASDDHLCCFFIQVSSNAL